RLFAEDDRVREVEGEHPVREGGVGLERVLRGEDAGGDDDGVEAAERILGLLERGSERLGQREIAVRRGDARAGASAGEQIGGAALELVLVAAQQREGVSALGHQARERAAEATGRAEDGGLHRRLRSGAEEPRAQAVASQNAVTAGLRTGAATAPSAA